jgi:hypothetical protein
MNSRLQVIMITASLAFLIYIIFMVRKRRVELKYTLAWLFAGFFLLTSAVFPGLLGLISGLLNIVEPVNTLFLLVIFFLMLILFTLTIALSRSSSRVKTLTQEIGIIKLELEKLRRNGSK